MTISEPDWRRLPGFRAATEAEWTSARWQRTNSVRSTRTLTPRIDCDVPGLGKLSVDQSDEHDRERGISRWRKGWRPMETAASA
jgi:hypothetical protein